MSHFVYRFFGHRLTGKLVGGTTLVAFICLIAGFYTTSHTAAKAGWLDQVFGGMSYSRTKSRARRRAPQRKRIKRLRESRYGRTRRASKAYGIGRVGHVRSKIKKKKSRKYVIPRSARGKTFRTMCVRTCDGYYFPVSFSASKRHFRKDAKVCQSSCASAKAKLFYYPNPGGKIKDMVSYRGAKKYGKLKNAFLSKKEFVSSCRCQPEAWTKAARSKHEKYALLEEKRLKRKAQRTARLRKKTKLRKKRRRVSRRRANRRTSRRHSRKRTRRYRIR